MSGTSTTQARSATRVEPSQDALRYLADHDYADAFRLTDAPSAPARTWAKLSIGSTPGIVQRTFGTVVWHGVLGFDLAPIDTDGTMVGWQIAVDQPDLFVLTVDGRLMTGCMVFRVEDEIVTWTTALHYIEPRAERIWGAAQHVHRALAGRLLARAAAHI